jgi:hypothetical protein
MERQSSSPAGLQGNAAEAKAGAFASFTPPRSRYGFPKRVNNLINNRLERFARVNNDCVLRFFERGELDLVRLFICKPLGASRADAGESSRVRGRRVRSVWGFAGLNDPAGAILFRISGSTN